jgi:glycosyltransferase involved in cell wall biosynthesis
MSAHRIIHLCKMTGAAGAEGHLLLLLPGLRARGLDARLWILVEPDNPVDHVVARAQACGIPVERIVIHHDLDPGLWRRLAARLRAAQADLVHTHLLHADLYGIPAARRARIPYVVSSRHNDDRFRYRLPVRLINRWLWRQTDAGIAISEAIRQFSIQVEGAPASRVHTIHYGLDPASVIAPPDARQTLRTALNIPADAPVAGSVCRLTGQKGLIDAIHAFARIAAALPDAHYVIAGDGPLRFELEAEVRALGLVERVHFLGWRDDAHAVLAALDVLLAPSLWEGFGLVLLEAMALQVPIIATRVSAIPEVVIDGETGWLVPPQDAVALAAALSDALTHPSATSERGTNGRRRLEAHFTAEKMIESTLALYQRLGVGA